MRNAVSLVKHDVYCGK